MNSLGVIVNPHSGKNLRSPTRIRDLREQLGRNGQFCLPQSVQELPEIIQELRANGMTTLAIDGGDGTIHQVINAAHKVYGSEALPKIALLKGGTMNNIARNVGVPLLKRSHQLLAELMTERERITVVRHSLLVDDKAGFIFGLGAVAQFLDLYELPPGRPTVTKAIRMVLKLLGSAIINGAFSRELFATQRQVFRQAANHHSSAETLTFDTRFTIVSTLSDIGFYVRPFHHTSTHPEELQLISMNRSARQVAALLPRMWRARALHGEGIVNLIGTSLEVDYERPQRYTIDGDLYTSEETQRFSVGPAIEFIIGTKP